MGNGDSFSEWVTSQSSQKRQIDYHKSVKQITAKMSNAEPQKRLKKKRKKLSKYTRRNMSLDYTISNGIMQVKKNNKSVIFAQRYSSTLKSHRVSSA